ncbi:MAG: flagellar biosynthetic protein FliR [Bdellovibrionota bacterium]
MDLYLQEHFFLTFLRIVGGTLILPGGYTLIPLTSRITLALALTFGCMVNPQGETTISPICYPIELIIGIILVFPMTLVVESFRTLGELLEQARGQNLGAMYGASQDISSDSPCARLLQMTFLSVFLVTGLYIDYVSLLLESFILIPVGMQGWHVGFYDFAVDFLQYSFLLLVKSFSLFLPVGFLFILCDLGMGFLSKLVPGLPIFGELFVIKSGLLFILLIGCFGLLSGDVAVELIEHAARMVRVTMGHIGVSGQ